MTIQVTIYSDDLLSVGVWKGRRFKVKEVRIITRNPRSTPNQCKEYICCDKNSSTGTVVIYYNECKEIS